MKKLIFISILLVSTAFAFGQKPNVVRGYVFDSKNGEAAEFVRVILTRLGIENAQPQGAYTDIDGFFQFPNVSDGDYALEIRSMDHEALFDTIKASGGKIITNKYELIMLDEVRDLEGINVYGEDQSKRTKIDISVNKLDQEALERLPSFGAENDILAAFSITPGVISTGDQGGQLYVRGGTPIQNKILLDGMTIYNPFHSIGFFSVFETELIKSADIYTGGFGAQYGGRISSIMDITYRDGDLKKHSGMVSASPFLGKLVLEGPMYRNKNSAGSGGSYIFSAKHSLLNYSSKTLYPYTNNGEGMPFSFTDIYGKITIKSPEGSKFNVFGFGNMDAVNYSNIAELNWQSFGGGANFRLVPTSTPMIINGHLNGSNYVINFIEQNGQKPRKSQIGGFDLGFDFTYFLRNSSEITYGINVAGFTTNFHTYNEVDREIALENFNTELGGYFNYRLVKGRWVVSPGIRIQSYPSHATVVPEPRLAVKLNATESFRISMSGGYYSQNYTSATSDRDIVNLFYGFLAAPNNVQSKFTNFNGKESNPKNGIQTSWHGILGFEYQIRRPLTVTIEGYYKYFPKLTNINTNKLYDDISEFSDKPDEFKKDFLVESGFSYGVDLLIEYHKDWIFLWGTYSFGNSSRWDGFDFYAPSFDRKHNVNLVATFSFLKDRSLEVSARWNFGSGLPFTPTSGYYQGETFDNGVTTDYTTSNPSELSILLGDMNSKRLPTYHRFDITIKKSFKFKKSLMLEVRGGVTNVYNRDNIFYVNRVTNEKIYQLPILPSLGVTFKW